MTIRFHLIIIFLLLSHCFVEAQSIYVFKFKNIDPADTTAYTAFFYINQNGTGTIRVRYVSPVSKEFENLDGLLKEEPLKDSTGFADATQMIYQTQSLKMYPAKSEMPFKRIGFLFSLNAQTNYLEPSKINIISNTENPITTSILLSNFLEKSTLKPSTVSEFYKDYDPDSVYTNLFKKTRGLTPLQRNSRIHLLLVANTIDKKIGANGAKDIDKMEETFYSITERLGIKEMKVIRITGQQFTKDNILAAVRDSLKPKPDDIVVFYYTGHGFRKPGKDSTRPYPFLDCTFKEGADYFKESINIEDIFLMIQKKQSNFNLVLSDCCNADYANAMRILGLDPNKRGSNMDWNADNIAKLFLSKQKISILATAAGKNQLASTNPLLGGFYTNYVLTAMKARFEKNAKDISWPQIFEEARTKTINKAINTRCSKNPDTGCEQYPLWKPVIANQRVQ